MKQKINIQNQSYLQTSPDRIRPLISNLGSGKQEISELMTQKLLDESNFKSGILDSPKRSISSSNKVLDDYEKINDEQQQLKDTQQTNASQFMNTKHLQHSDLDQIESPGILKHRKQPQSNGLSVLTKMEISIEEQQLKKIEFQDPPREIKKYDIKPQSPKHLTSKSGKIRGSLARKTPEKLPIKDVQKKKKEEELLPRKNNNYKYMEPFIYDKYEQRVVETYKNGARYEGMVSNALKNGKGQIYYPDGGVYYGDWEDNQCSGQGMLFYPSGKIAYEGSWKEDKLSGEGTIYNEKPKQIEDEINYKNLNYIGDFWTKYDGNFLLDEKSGYGIVILTNKERFAGYWKHDRAHGPGKYYKRDGTVISGYWQNNILVKQDDN